MTNEEFMAINNRDFKAPYVFREFPKWVHMPDGKSVIVQSADEESELIQGFVKNDPDTDVEREELLQKAKDLGLRIHPSIGTDKLREKVNAAKE